MTTILLAEDEPQTAQLIEFKLKQVGYAVVHATDGEKALALVGPPQPALVLLDGLNLAFKGPLDTAFVQQTHAAGLKFYVWTVDDAEVARKLVAAGVDGLTTNRPGWLRAQLR